MSLEVVPVHSGRDLERFIAFPYTLHRRDPLWVPPLRMDVRTILSPKKNPFFQHAQAEYFIARDGGRMVGRIAAIRERGQIPQAASELDAEGSLLSPPLVDPHVHMDAVLTVGEPRYNESGTLIEGILTWAERKPFLLVGSALTSIFVIGVVALEAGVLGIPVQRRLIVDLRRQQLASATVMAGEQNNPLELVPLAPGLERMAVVHPITAVGLPGALHVHPAEAARPHRRQAGQRPCARRQDGLCLSFGSRDRQTNRTDKRAIGIDQHLAAHMPRRRSLAAYHNAESGSAMIPFQFGEGGVD